jgi:drug/metabolite transporter (DMT)-like permease
LFPVAIRFRVDPRPGVAERGHLKSGIGTSVMSDTSIDAKGWALLLTLSVLWGASFFFAAIVVQELPPLTSALARVALAALLLLPIHGFLVGRLPALALWPAFLVMGLFNNVIPFSLFLTSQQNLPSGLASVLNATTPLFTTLVMAAAGEERLLARRVVGVAVGLLGVAVLTGLDARALDGRAIDIGLCLAAALSYGCAALWGRRRLRQVPPLTSATCQLVSSSLILLPIVAVLDRPWHSAPPNPTVWLALLGFAALSTALAYIVFFMILVRSGATNVMLVTLLIPVTSVSLGALVLGESLHAHEIIGALIIASSLLIIDGRLLPGGGSRR